MYSCDYTDCDYQGSKSGLRTHKMSKHLGITFPCDQCSYVANSAGNLSLHKHNKHSDIRSYPCDRCSYLSKTLDNLKQHVEAVHDKAGVYIFY